MLLPTAEFFLSNLPTLLLIWTAWSFSWGSYVLFAFGRKLFTVCNGCINYRRCDIHNMFVIAIFLLLLAISMMLGSIITNYQDAVVVLNVFFDTYLLYLTFILVRLWEENPKCHDTVHP